MNDAVYTERAQLIAALSKLFPASLEEQEGAEDDWRTVCFIDLPTGQVSWHIAKADLGYFSHLQRGAGRVWDGHDTADKYTRLNALSAAGVLDPSEPVQFQQTTVVSYDKEEHQPHNFTGGVVPSVGRAVHYLSYGTPNGEFPPARRAATITDVRESDEHGFEVRAAVLNPDGLFFTGWTHFDETAAQGGTVHWPERV